MELGLKVCVLEDQHQFILYHQVMEKQMDNEVAVPMVDETRKRFPQFKSLSFDKGFHSPDNQKELSENLDCSAEEKRKIISNSTRDRIHQRISSSTA